MQAAFARHGHERGRAGKPIQQSLEVQEIVRFSEKSRPGMDRLGLY